MQTMVTAPGRIPVRTQAPTSAYGSGRVTQANFMTTNIIERASPRVAYPNSG